MLIHYIIFGSLNPNTNKTNRITKFSKKYTNKNPSNKATHITTQISIAIATLFSTKLCAKIATLLAQNINIRSSKQQHNTIIQQSNNILLHKHQQTIQTNRSSKLKAMNRYGYLQSK